MKIDLCNIDMAIMTNYNMIISRIVKFVKYNDTTSSDS